MVRIPLFSRRSLPIWMAALTLAVGVALLPAVEAAPDAAPSTTTSAQAVARQVDQMIGERLKDEDVTPAPLADDATFLRRLYLDVLGNVPTPETVKAFVADRSQDKRTRLIDELLDDEGYASYWSMWWYRTLTGLSVNARGGRDGQGARALQGAGGQRFHDWLEGQLGQNRRYDEMVFDMLTATGRTDENGAAVYYARWEGNANNTIGAVTRHFLGLQIQCAQCHDHIYEETWKQSDFKGMAAFFATTRQRRVPEYQELRAIRKRQQEAQAKAREQGEPAPRRGGLSQEDQQKLRMLAGSRNVVEVSDFKINPRAARLLKNRAARNPEAKARMELMAVQPKIWHGPAMEDIPGISRRLLLARWITAEDNPYFAQALSNRLWGTLLGTGFVNPVDDFNSVNEPSHPAILALLAKDFRAHDYDLKRMLRIILNTDAYQRSSVVEGGIEVDPMLFSHGKVRPLTTDQLPHALVRAIGLEDNANFQRARKAARSIRTAIARSLTFVFDDDEGAEAEDFEGSIPQGLFLMNSQVMSRISQGKRGLMAGLVRRIGKDDARIEHLYLSTYGREPSRKERSVALKFVRGGDTPEAAYGDLLWALINSAEFMTNH